MALALCNLISCWPRLNPSQHRLPANIYLQNYQPDRCSFNVYSAIYTPQISLPNDPIVERRSANYQPTVWSYDFLQSLNNHHADILHKDRAATLEQELRCAINDEGAESLKLLELIDDIQRFGLRHRFEMDISRALEKFVFAEKSGVKVETNLHAEALRFRLRRQHGYQVSPDVFKAFKDHKGNFMECLREDVKGMLSLYEATHLAFEGEDLMDEARIFTRIHLKDLMNSNTMNKDLLEQVNHALELPLHRRMLRLEARWYTENYSKKAALNLKLLELSKLDFNMVQSTLQEDLKDMSIWWKEMGLASKLNFARDRITECFFWSTGMVSQPEFRNCLKGLTKVASLITTIDDVYDVYGTLEELELFTDMVQRWDTHVVKNLPDCMKLCFLALHNSVNEMAYDTFRDLGVDILPYLTKAWADLCNAFLQEAKWAHNKQVPAFQDYLENAWVSVSGLVLLVHAYFLETSNITNLALESLENNHDLLRCSSVIFRLCNDLGTSKDELERGESANSITCYMKETGCSEVVARQYISDLIDQSWKKMNQCRTNCCPFSKQFVEMAINLARISHCTYQHGDGHGCPDDRSKNRVASLIIEPISIN